MSQPSRRPLILGNWKMNTSLDDALALASAVEAMAGDHPTVDVGILPPAIWLIPLHQHRQQQSRLGIGAQDVSAHENGAYTGELSVTMLAPWCDCMLVGHSERRQYHHEDDRIVKEKLDAVLAGPATAILAVGESEQAREDGEAESTVTRQLDATLTGRTDSDLARVVVAYEPVWAIGTGRSASASDAQDMAQVIRTWLSAQYPSVAATTRILYGGSMKPGNADELLAQPDIDGGLVGGASLHAEDFGGIIGAASRH